MKYIILLTACVNPDGMPFTKLTNSTIRKKMYLHAIDFYITHTTLPVVFVENSYTDLSPFFEKFIRNGRLEMLTFKGNNDKSRGKGFGEAEIIDYAITNSNIIDCSCFLIKITGRLIVKNIVDVVSFNNFFKSNKSVQCAANSQFLYADSRIFIASVPFLKCFMSKKNQIDDSKKVYFEHVLLNTIKESNSFFYFPFIIEPQIFGMSGSTGKLYGNSSNSYKDRISYFYYQLWILVNYPDFSLKRLSRMKSYVIYIVFFLTKSLYLLFCH